MSAGAEFLREGQVAATVSASFTYQAGHIVAAM